MPKRLHSTAPATDRAYLVGLDSHGARLTAAESLDELAELAATAGADVVGRTSQRVDRPNPATYVRKGKLEEVQAEVARLNANVVVFDDELSPSQQNHLEDALGVKVLDRTALILDIFATRANTREGRLQVELAQLNYLAPRLRGQWQHLERMEGAIGLRGPGETQLETDRRLIRGRIAKIRRDLEGVRTQRALYRRQRRRAGIPVVALVGYTNAGKSTLMGALSGASVTGEDRLFATLDPLTRRVHMPGGEPVLLTDTVGFIQKLPTGLVAAFRATLEELTEADLLLHVVDISHPNAAEHTETVDETLADLGVESTPAIVVLNKADLVTDAEGVVVTGLAAAEALMDPAGPTPENVVLVSGTKGWGLDTLRAKIAAALDGALVDVAEAAAANGRSG